MAMEINHFFEFSSKLVSTTFHARAVGLKRKDDKDSLGDALRLFIGNHESVSFPVTFKQFSGKNLYDVLDTGWAGLYLISDHMQSVLEENKLSGWETFPIRLLEKNGAEIKGYQGFSITGRCGPIDISKSEVIQKRLVPNGPLSKFYKGYHIGLNEWDGRDFFLPKHY